MTYKLIIYNFDHIRLWFILMICPQGYTSVKLMIILFFFQVSMISDNVEIWYPRVLYITSPIYGVILLITHHPIFGSIWALPVWLTFFTKVIQGLLRGLWGYVVEFLNIWFTIHLVQYSGTISWLKQTLSIIWCKRIIAVSFFSTSAGNLSEVPNCHFNLWRSVF